MAFYYARGKRISVEDANYLGKIFSDLMSGYKEGLESAKEKSTDNESDSISHIFDRNSVAFLRKFSEKSISDDRVDLDTFFHDEMFTLYTDIKKDLSGKTKRYASSVENKMTGELKEYFSEYVKVKDTTEGLNRTIGSFKLLQKPLSGIEEISSYSPIAGTASENWANKENVSFGDIYAAFSSLNHLARNDNTAGGKVRARSESIGAVNGVLSVAVPCHLFRTLTAVSENMNKIKLTEDDMLRRSQAIQLASFALMMNASLMPFEFDNLKSGRLFADTILEAFGVPAHVPSTVFLAYNKTIGEQFDFDKSTLLLLKGIKMNDCLIKAENGDVSEQMQKLAENYLFDEHISLKCPSEINPAAAIKMAATVKLGKSEIVDGLIDLINADQNSIRNSFEYKNLIVSAKNLVHDLNSEDINSPDCAQAFHDFSGMSIKYVKHCRENPLENPMRSARLRATETLSLGASKIYAEAKKVRNVQLRDIVDGVKARKESIAENFKNGGDIMECLAEYSIAKMIESDMNAEPSKYSVDKYKSMLRMDPRIVSIVKNDADLQKALQDPESKAALEKNNFEGLLNIASEKYQGMKDSDLSRKAKAIPDVQKEKAENAELSYLNFG